MKKFLPIVIVVALIAVLGVGGWFYLNKVKGTITPTAGTQGPAVGEEQEGAEGQSFTGKLKDALQLGQSMKCTWKQDEANYATSYIKGDNIRTDVTAKGKLMHSIMKDNCTYSWEEGSTQGFKICFEPGTREAEEEVEAPEEYQEASGQTADFDYQCSPTVVSDTMFNPPVAVKFLSAEDLMQGAGE